MDVKALLMVEANDALPLAQLDVLGASLTQRMAASLLAAGINGVTVLSAYAQAEAPRSDLGELRYVKSSAEEIWHDAQTIYETMVSSGTETVILIRCNSYCDIDWKRFLDRHHQGVKRLTRAWQSATEPMDLYAVDPKFHRDTAFLFHSRLEHPRLSAGCYQIGESEYVHSIRTAADLRAIAVDGLNLRCGVRPVGKEVRPGIWRADGSRVDAGVRLVAPLYIGKHARVRRGAVITRGSSLEHHSSVDCGTVIENTSVLPFATVGAGLDLFRKVVGSRQVIDLKRNVAVTIHDRTLVDEAAHNVGLRVVTKAAVLAAYLPMQLWRGVAGGNALPEISVDEICDGDFEKAVRTKRKPAARALRPELVMERYGNQ